MVADGTFPKQIKIGRRAVAWLETEIDDWMHERISKL
jgi:prophage regulatory protein